MLRPKKTKFKKYRKSFLKNCEKNTSLLSKYHEGTVRILSLQFGKLSGKQLQSCNSFISKKIKRFGKCLLKTFPDFPVTKKPQEVRMGKGKGSVDYWSSKVSPGGVIFELSGAKKLIAFLTFHSVANKLPIKTKIIA